jgi:hypothetical protein
MRWKPVVVQSEDAGGGLVVMVGHPLVDDYLEFLRARARPNTIRAVAFDLKVFFTVVDKTHANEYASVAAKVEALYGQDQPLEADAAGPTMR